MAISFISNALGGTTTTTSFSITAPTTAADDIMILEFTHRGTGNGTIGGTTVTTGGLTWALKHSQLYATSAFSGKTYWTRCTGNHAGQTVTGSSLTNSCAAILTLYRGCVATGDPLNDSNVIGEQNAAANETQAQIATSTAGAYVVLVVANSPDLDVSAQSCLSLTTFTERAERLSTGGTDTSISHASGEKATAGNTGAFTWAQSDAASGSWAYAIVPLAAVNVTVTPTGVSGAGKIGTTTVAAGATKVVTGTTASGATGTVSLTGGATVTATGASSQGQVGTVTVETINPDVTVVVSGVAGAGQLGSVTPTAASNTAVTGLASSGAMGSVEITGGCVVSVTGVFGLGHVGDEYIYTENEDGVQGDDGTTPYVWQACRSARGRR